MLEKIIKISNKDFKEKNIWTINNFASKNQKGFLTFPTKFDMVDSILKLNHNGKIIIRVSVNPEEIIKKVEFGTSPLSGRIDAINRLVEAGYKVGILIAPIILVDNWETLYSNLIKKLYMELSSKAKKSIFFEVIFMTYSYIHTKINSEAFPNAINLYNKELMTGRGKRKIYV